jgi:threonine dehydrogenase-like Zn-dependent dehydrogenase
MEAQSFPLGAAINLNLAIDLGNCNHRSYVTKLVEILRVGVIDPVKILTKRDPDRRDRRLQQFAKRMPGWIKTERNPEA